MKVIANTMILSNFAAVGRLEVWRDLLGEVYITCFDKPNAQR